MSDAMWLEGKEYISSKRAAELSSYAQDYIGQLARKGLIDARRIGGLWFISMASLSEYKSHADAYIPQQPERKQTVEVDSLVSFDGKDHISASRAAKITGYHPDYVGQLARSGAIISRQVGNRWYIDREGILAHKHEKDSLLGAVQAQSVGLARGPFGRNPTGEPMVEGVARDDSPLSQDVSEGAYSGPGPFLTYTRDDGDLLPVLEKSEPVSAAREDRTDPFAEKEFDQEYAVPIRRVLPKREILQHTGHVKHVKSANRAPGKTIYYGTFGKVAAAALTIVIVLSFGFATLKNSSVYGTNMTRGGLNIQRNAFTASAAEALRRIGYLLENLFVTELVYKRGDSTFR